MLNMERYIEVLTKKYCQTMDEELIKQFAQLVNSLIEQKLVEIEHYPAEVRTEYGFMNLVQKVRLKFTGMEELERLRIENEELRLERECAKFEDRGE